MSNKRLIKSTGIISFGILCSRVLGFARDILIANFFGTTMLAEAFVVSFRIPNLMRDLVGEGAANAAFVPVLTDYHTKHPEKDFWQLSRSLLYILIAVLFVISLSGVLLAPSIVRLIAPGFMGDPVKMQTTIALTRVMFPFIFLAGLVAYGMGVLNSLNHFTAPAFGPMLLNISMIFFLIYVCPKMGIMGLATAVLVGGILQVLILAVVLYKKGFRLKMPRHIFHPAIKRIWKLLIPRVFGSAVYQLSVVVDNIFSTFGGIVGIGGPAALWYSYRLFHLPLAIFGIALATVALPKMSREVAKNNIPALKETIGFSMRSVFLVLIPAGIGLATLGEPIIRILFQRGEFTAYSTSITYSALFFYSFGLFACGGIKILVNSFFSLGDTLTPVKIASISFCVNLVLNYILMWPLKLGGLALATSIAATSNFILLYIFLTRKIGNLGTRRIAKSFLRIVIAGIIMGVFSSVGANLLNGFNRGFVLNMLSIALIVLLSVGIYSIVCIALGVPEMKKFVKWILKRE